MEGLYLHVLLLLQLEVFEGVRLVDEFRDTIHLKQNPPQQRASLVLLVLLR